jgi:hypothetical protein
VVDAGKSDDSEDCMKRAYYALGRLKSGELNKTESAFAKYLEERRIVGDILWWRFEAIKLKLADGCFYSPDFAVIDAAHQLILYEVKGKTRKTRADGTKYDAAFAQDDSRVKIKLAADTFPFVMRMVYPATGGGWNEEEF